MSHLDFPPPAASQSAIVDYYLVFPDRATALAVYAALARMANPDLPEDYAIEDFPSNGRFGNNYYDIVDVGAVWRPTEAVDGNNLPVMEPVPGYHLIGRFRGPDPLPEQLEAFLTEPWGQVIG